jgi:hypothetical protein
MRSALKRLKSNTVGGCDLREHTVALASSNIAVAAHTAEGKVAVGQRSIEASKTNRLMRDKLGGMARVATQLEESSVVGIWCFPSDPTDGPTRWESPAQVKTLTPKFDSKTAKQLILFRLRSQNVTTAARSGGFW